MTATVGIQGALDGPHPISIAVSVRSYEGDVVTTSTNTNLITAAEAQELAKQLSAFASLVPRRGKR